MKKQLLPDNVFELLFGVGAGVVIIGALLKIINGSLIFSANTWLIVGLSVEAGTVSYTHLTLPTNDQV